MLNFREKYTQQFLAILSIIEAYAAGAVRSMAARRTNRYERQQWQVIHPDGSAAHPEFDEGYRLALYASYEHWQATGSAASLGGNGPDFDKFREALRIRRGLTIETSLQYFRDYLYQSPPKFMPGLGEAYRAVEGTN
jgi:hypothetical protein